MKTKFFLLSTSFSIYSFLLFSQHQTGKIQLEDAVASRKYLPETIREIRSMKDGKHYTTLEHGAWVVRYHYSDGLPVDTLFSVQWAQHGEIPYISGYEFSSDESKLLISTNETEIYRHSFTAEYYVYDIKTHSLLPVSGKGSQELASFSPGSDKVAFVRQSNIYILDLIRNKETQITFDGKQNEIINGKPDWVYEEEFSFTRGFEWSPDGMNLAFMRFDERLVKMYTIPVYDSLYPTLTSYKYPKAGEKNSIVNIRVYNLASGKTRSMDADAETDQYIPRIQWTFDPNKLGIIRLNRLQNKVDLLLADISTGKAETIYTETNQYFISEIGDNYLTFLENGSGFVVFSERDGYQHLYHYSLSGKLLNRITTGNFDVDELLGIDQKKGEVYYTSAELSSTDRQVYAVKLDGNGKTRLTAKNGSNSAEFSNQFKYYIDTWSNANTPPQYTLYDIDGRLIRTLEDNHALESTMKEDDFSKKEIRSIPVSKDLELNAFIIKPAGFDSTRKYPLFMYVYGGPESQQVLDKWDSGMAWFQMLAQQGYIVACVDNRGTDGRGEAFRKCTYEQLGKLETLDQMSAAQYFGNLAYVDKTRIGIFGWSYGGYMACLCMTKGADLFKMGIAVAPVTNWRFYDSVYTERFMRTPQENPKGYDDNSPINFADMLKGKFLLIHGSADDNVHLQNSMVFTDKLVQAGKSFDMFIYPDKKHGISGEKTRLHLYSKMTDFILNNL